MHFGQCRFVLSSERSHHIGVDDAGGHAVHGNAAGTFFFCQCLGQADEARLGGGIVYLAAAAGLAPHAAHRQDAARLAPDHARQRQLAQVERTGQVHVQHVLPFFRGDVGEQLLLCDAGIAHQHIHPTQRLFRRTERQLAPASSTIISWASSSMKLTA